MSTEQAEKDLDQRSADAEHLELRTEDARVQSFDRVTIHTWETSIKPGMKAWTMGPLEGTVVSGGIHVHGWFPVHLTDTYPTGPNGWRIGSSNDGNATVDVTLYAITLG
jgi:hypothetical protein